MKGFTRSMSMDEFFKAWAETVLAGVALKIGGVLRTGRQRQTVTPLNWDPPYLGSQKSLVPDLVLEREDQTVIVDAKYKEHWEEMQRDRWTNLDEDIRQRHREDLLQVLAYANLSTKARTVVCLVYPCREETGESLRERSLIFNRASVAAVASTLFSPRLFQFPPKYLAKPWSRWRASFRERTRRPGFALPPSSIRR